MKDTLIQQGRRNNLIRLLNQKGITDKNVLEAMRNTPRHWFMDTGLEEWAYEDKAYPIAANQTISQPYTVAFQSSLLQTKKGDKVLEIGTGSGYQTAVLIEMGLELYTIERQHELFKKTSLLFNKLKKKPKKLIFGDGYKGFSTKAPYDAILVTAGSESIPERLLEQLKIGGRLVIPVGKKDQEMWEYTRISEEDYDKKNHGAFNFVPLLEGINI